VFIAAAASNCPTNLDEWLPLRFALRAARATDV
jgi:hypothetical protein